MAGNIVSRTTETLVLLVIVRGCLSAGLDGEIYPNNWWDDPLEARSNSDRFAPLRDEENASTASERFAEPSKRVVQPEIPTLLTSRQGFCSCGSQYVVRDLGNDHYPRFLTVARCKPRYCRIKRTPCRLLHYMVHVLRRRRATEVRSRYVDNQLTDIPLPEPIRGKWQLKSVSVPVACFPDSTKS